MKKLICVFTILGISSSFSIANLIGHWTFDDSFKDSSDNKHHGILEGKPVKFIEGKHGKAVEFSGASAISCGNVSLGKTGKITIAFWAKPTKPERSWGGIIQKQNRDYSERSFWIGAHQHGIMWAYFSPSNVKGRPLKALKTVKTGEWLHVGMTFDGAYQRTYINGKFFSTSAKRDAPFVDGGDIFRFGRVENTKGGYYWGGLDDVWVFSDALSEEKIAQIMTGSDITKPAKPEQSSSFISGAQLPISKDLLLDLNANLGVEMEDGNRVKSWHNTVKNNDIDVFVKRDEGRKKAGSGRPTLKKKVAALGGHSTLIFNQQELVNMQEDACDHLLQGRGFTWLTVISINNQPGGRKNMNAFFGNLRNSFPYDGFLGSLLDDNRVWTGTRNSKSIKEKGKMLPLWEEEKRPCVSSPEALEKGRYYILAGRMGAGTGMVDLELFINSANAVDKKTFQVTPDSNPSRLVIGQERDAITHPGAESFDGEISRFLVYERPLSDTELATLIQHLVKTYKIQMTVNKTP